MQKYWGKFQLNLCYRYDGSVIDQRSIDLGDPVIYVTMAYRYA